MNSHCLNTSLFEDLLYTYIPISSDFSVSSFQCFIFVLQIVKTDVRELWNLEYEIEEIQTEFAKGIGSIDIANLTDDFVEDVMLQSKPLQGILMAIRLRQKVCNIFTGSPRLSGPRLP